MLYIVVYRSGVRDIGCGEDRCTMADMPDLSYLTAEEREIIEGVMKRQKQEEQRENEIMR